MAPLTPFWKNIPPPSPFWKIFWGILLIYVACSGLFNKRRAVYLQRSARRSGMPDPWNWSPSKCTTQHPRRSHFWCTKSQVWSGWKTIAEIQKGLRLNNALLIKTRTMQRTTGKFVSWFLSPYFIEDNIWKIHSFTNLLRRSIIWPIYNYCRFTETQKHQVYTCNIQQHQHNHAHWLAEFFNLSFDICTDYVWDMPFVLVISYISVTQSFISLRILRMSSFMLQVAVSSLHIDLFFHKIPMVRLCEDCSVLFSIY